MKGGLCERGFYGLLVWSAGVAFCYGLLVYSHTNIDWLPLEWAVISYWNTFLFYKVSAENCMKMKEYWTERGLVPEMCMLVPTLFN